MFTPIMILRSFDLNGTITISLDFVVGDGLIWLDPCDFTICPDACSFVTHVHSTDYTRFCVRCSLSTTLHDSPTYLNLRVSTFYVYVIYRLVGVTYVPTHSLLLLFLTGFCVVTVDLVLLNLLIVYLRPAFPPTYERCLLPYTTLRCYYAALFTHIRRCPVIYHSPVTFVVVCCCSRLAFGRLPGFPTPLPVY